MRFLPFVRVAFVFCAAAFVAGASPVRQSLPMQDDSPAQIYVYDLTGDSKSVVQAAEVSVVNNSGSALAYELTISSGSDHSVARTLTVPANASRSVVLVVPTDGSASWSYTTVSASGPGTGSGTSTSLSSSNSANDPVQVGLSSKLNSDFAGRWKAAIDAASNGTSSGTVHYSHGSSNDPGRVTEIDTGSGPADWRVWRGLRRIAMTSDEWRTVCASPAMRDAFFRYAGQGGRIAIIAGKDTALPSIPSGKSELRFGFGDIRVYPETADVAMKRFEKAGTLDDAGPFAISPSRNLSAALLGSTGANTGRPLEKLLPPPARAGLVVALIVVLFAAVVGPVNLFYFCRGPRRHRMLWTTPAIALAFSSVIIAYVFVADGTGGDGYRRRVRMRPAGTSLEFLMQEQSSRTGLVVGSAFDLPEDALMWRRADDSKTIFRGPRGNGTLRRVDDRASGDWFRSRLVQTQYLEEWRSERGGVALAGPADNPTLRSSVDGTLSKVFVRTVAGSWRVAENVAPGATVATRPAKSGEFAAWYAEVTKTCSPAQLDRLAAIRNASGMWFAESPDLRAGAPDTLASIRWKNLPDLLVGDLSPAAGAAE